MMEGTRDHCQSGSTVFHRASRSLDRDLRDFIQGMSIHERIASSVTEPSNASHRSRSGFGNMIQVECEWNQV
jgi:hypothetical protein